MVYTITARRSEFARTTASAWRDFNGAWQNFHDLRRSCIGVELWCCPESSRPYMIARAGIVVVQRGPRRGRRPGLLSWTVGRPAGLFDWSDELHSADVDAAAAAAADRFGAGM